MSDAAEHDRSTPTRVVVIGGSAGAIETLRHLMGQLPPTLPAAVCVVVHIPAASRSMLPQILGNAGPLPATHAQDGEPLRAGRVYVAPPDQHLRVEEGRLRLDRGPKENRHRPAVDSLFRSAAAAYRERVIGVVLSGMLDDGTLGLMEVKRCGGVTVVQDPADAVFAEMPRSAIASVEIDHVLPTHALAGALTALVRADAKPEDAIVAEQTAPLSPEDEHRADLEKGEPSTFSCPDCGGVLWAVEEEKSLVRFRCRTGHAYSPDALHDAQMDTLEQALWTALRALAEKAALSRRLAERTRRSGQVLAAERYLQQALQAERDARAVRAVILHTDTTDAELRKARSS